MEKPKSENIMELALRKSFFFPSAEIYPDNPAGFWDFGPTGQSIRRKIIDVWRRELVQKEDMLEIYGAQILPKNVFEGSGHLRLFNDPIVQCLKCKKFYRADQLISEETKQQTPEATPLQILDQLIKKNNIKCNKCKGEFSEVTHFNMMVETLVGKGESKTYLRPESCQSIFLDFLRMTKTMRLKLPQGIAQVGGAFRNEISPRQSIIRAIEFSQMEIELFFDPDKIDEIKDWDEVKDYKIKILRLKSKNIEEISAKDLVSKKIVQGKLIAYYLARTQQTWNKLGVPLTKLRFREVGKDERPFYSLLTFDFEVETSIGWLELIANNYRADYDLKGHMLTSRTNLEYTDEGRKFIPHIWEISAGVDRTLYVLLEIAHKEQEARSYLKLERAIAPFDCAVFPLINKGEIRELAKKIANILKNAWFEVSYDESGSIGRRYARADEIGIPFVITTDQDSLKNEWLTIRDRDTTKQIKVQISNLKQILTELIKENKELKDFGKYIN